MGARTSPAPSATPFLGGIIPDDGRGASECVLTIRVGFMHTLPSEWPQNPKEIAFPYLPLYSLPYRDFISPMADNSPQDAVGFTSVAPVTVQRILEEGSDNGNRPTPPSGGRDEEAETFAAGLSKKRKRATAKKTTAKVVTPDTGAEGVSKKTKGPGVSQTLEGFIKVTGTSAIALGHLRHIRDFYKIETGVKARIPFAGETIDTPMVDPAAAESDLMESGYVPVCWEFLNYGLRLPSSAFVNSVLVAIDRAPSQLCLFAWATLTAFQAGCLVVRVVPSLNLFSRVSYLDVILGNRLLSEMLVSGVPSSSATVSSRGISDHSKGLEERSLVPLPTPTPADQHVLFP
ncbi:hypothetical protein LIER_01340 [Lithospermum erythrorhizon]|uniref:Uncharacterized protein n=1 Tax=Lithospermum erythrorhizon TaxID=34254 RepID=A0AAV3NP83_LITER